MTQRDQSFLKKTRNEEILDLYLESWTEAEIGKKLLIAQKTVSNVIADSKKGINSQITIPDPLQIGDVWLFSSCDDAYGISGFPGCALYQAYQAIPASRRWYLVRIPS